MAFLSKGQLKWLWLALVLIVLDQASKWWVFTQLEYKEQIPITTFFNLVHHHNPGAAFSFLASAGGWQRWLFMALALLVSVVLTVWLSRIKEQRWVEPLGLAGIIAGALGNGIDRVYHGFVVDFLQFYIPDSDLPPWPSFNVADIAICVGVGFLIVDMLFLERKRR